MSSEPCIHYLKNASNRGISCTYSHQKPISGTKYPRSSEICRYFLMGQCAFGNGCKRSHTCELKEVNADYSYNEGSSNLYDSPVDNGMARSDKGSAGEGEDVQDSLPSGHVLDPSLSEEYPEPEVQDSGSSQDDVLNSTPSNIHVNEGNADETCRFFLDGSCGSGSDCDFPHSMPKDTEAVSSGRRKGPKSSKSYLYSSFFIPDHVAHRISHYAKALRLLTQEGLQTLPPGALPTRERLQISPSTGPAAKVIDNSSRCFHRPLLSP